ncbi:MAG: Hsp20/alpha crystallin family protein [Acidobacteriota bacterium]
MPDLISWGTSELAKLKDDMDRRFCALFEDFGLPRAVCPEGGIRLEASGDDWLVTCPLSGFEPEEVAVSVSGRVLSISAAREQDGGRGSLRMARELTLPFAIEAAEAGFSGGTLTVRLRRQGLPPVRSIPVRKS